MKISCVSNIFKSAGFSIFPEWTVINLCIALGLDFPIPIKNYSLCAIYESKIIRRLDELCMFHVYLFLKMIILAA